ncbi:hypothetical protein L4D09_02365 [Photobacterium makurazakiensis]|uniref:hypothetical protein n=1 Tax=Photobacterium makurazakiensis TaxID=2910234 RepID=UPI003D12D51C
MSHICPHCQLSVTAPAVKDYDEFFVCKHCHSALSHHEQDILLYALVFIVAITAPLAFILKVNIFVALSIAMLAYHFMRQRFIEPFFRLRLVDLYPRQVN